MHSIGVLIMAKKDTDFVAKFKEAQEMGMTSCQINVWDMSLYSDEMAERINNAMKETGFKVSLIWAGWTGPVTWNFTDGPATIGLVPEAYRAHRLQELLKASEFAAKIGVTDIATHVGFIPENPCDPLYTGLVSAMKYLCKKLQERGQNFLFETGQETPITVLRTIEDIGTGNAFINFDTANVILYGKGSAVDAIRVFGKYVRNTHIKDGFYPTDGKNLGREVKVGEGLANIPQVVEMLLECGYEGPFTIEREIAGEVQRIDIAATAKFLNEILAGR